MSTGIQWTDATWNPLRARHRTNGSEGWACVRVSEGCKNCYAATQNESQRWGRGTGLDYTVPNLAKVEHYLDEETLTQPLRWKKPRRVFVCSMTDLFGEWVTDDQLDRIFAVMALTPQHTYQVLTKRPERMRAYLTSDDRSAVWHEAETHAGEWDRSGDVPWWPGWPLPNVWLGVSVEDQERADERIPLLLDTPAAVRFLSCEPLLGAVDLTRVDGAGLGIDFHGKFDALEGLTGTETRRLSWVIVGGESGPNARPFDLAWARSLVQQCQTAGVAVFVKQLGAHVIDRNDAGFDGDGEDEWPAGTRVEEVWPHGQRHQGDPVRIKLRHNHGGNPEEWPEELRVREFPATSAVPA